MEKKFLTNNAATQHVLYQAAKVAKVNTPVLILGESGTGKELLANHIHQCSPRHDKPFVVLNCATIPRDLLESELFGYEAGAFTGAVTDHKGVFEYATEGTIFLDEVCDIPRQTQVKLLRALQSGEIKRLGSNKIIKVNPAIISATSHDIEEAVASGELRDDFYYRLAVVTLKIPSLRERPEDIDLLIDHFISFYSEKSHKDKPQITTSARKFLHRHNWSGNVRELENIIEGAVVLAQKTIDKELLGVNLSLNISAIDNAVYDLRLITAKATRQAESEMIAQVLTQTSGNKAAAARLLGISYKTLLNKVKEYEINVRP